MQRSGPFAIITACTVLSGNKNKTKAEKKTMRSTPRKTKIIIMRLKKRANKKHTERERAVNSERTSARQHVDERESRTRP